MRAFIAVDIDEVVRKEIDGIMTRLKKGAQFTSANPAWVSADNIHITLKFLGEISDDMIPKIEKVLKKTAAETKPFDLEIRKIGVFPDMHRPKVVWIGIDHGKKLLFNLQENLEKKMVLNEFESEDRPFSPHITIARLKSLKGTAQFMDVVHSHVSCSAGTCLIKELILFKSVLKPGGPEYTPLIKVPFGG